MESGTTMEEMKTSAELRALAESIEHGMIAVSHYPTCWKTHPACALKHAANVIDALETFLLNEKIELLKEAL